MSWVAAAVAGGAVVGGALNASAAGKAADAQTGASNAAIGLSDKQFNQSRSDLAPYRNLGDASTLRISQLLGLPLSPQQSFDADAYLRANPDVAKAGVDPYQHYVQFGQYEGRSAPQLAGAGAPLSVNDVMAMDPGYQFRLNEGMKSGRNIAGARGMINSGATAKALTRYGQDYASGEYNNIFNRLANAAGMGQGAVNTGVNAGAANAGNVGNLMTGAANARGAAAIGQANAYGGALNTVGGYYGQQNTLDKILASRGGSGAGGYGGYTPAELYAG